MQHVRLFRLNIGSVSFTASIFVVWLSRKIRKPKGEDLHPNNTRREPLQVRRLPWKKFLLSTSLWITVFCILYFAYAVLFGIALGKWNVDKFGYCYRDRGITSPDQQHPEADHIYLSITCLNMFSLLYGSFIESEKPPVLVDTFLPDSIRQIYDKYVDAMASCEKKVNSAIGALFTKCISLFPTPIRAKITDLSSRLPLPPIFNLRNPSTELGLVIVPVAQFLLYLYVVWAIRSANRMHLQGESEDTWGFGQVVALIQILPILKGCAKDCMGKTAPRSLYIC